MISTSALLLVPTVFEFEVLRSTLGATAKKLGKRSFFESANSPSVIVLQAGMGKVWAAAAAEAGIEAWKPSTIVDFGIAGGLNPNLQEGDWFAANEVLEYDYQSSFKPCPLIQIKRDLKAHPKLHTGRLLAGDVDVLLPERRQFLHEKYGADAVCWEASAVLRVAAFHAVPELWSFRMISDVGSQDLSTIKKTTSALLPGAFEGLLSVLTN